MIASEDDGIRKETTMQSLAKLKTVFKKDGTTTAGNSSQISDGAAAVLLARRSVAERLNLPIVARFVSYAVKGCPPEIMGIGPAVAIPELLSKSGTSSMTQGLRWRTWTSGKLTRPSRARRPTAWRSWE